MLENARESIGETSVVGTERLDTESNDVANLNTVENVKSVQDSTTKHVPVTMDVKTVHCNQDNVPEKSLEPVMLGEQFIHLINLTNILYFNIFACIFCFVGVNTLKL